MGGGDHKEKTTIIMLKVDLQCPCCYKKTKKILCKIPQVRDQLYDEKSNTDKLCCKGGKTIKSSEIKELKKVVKLCESKYKPHGRPGDRPVAFRNIKGAETPEAVKKPDTDKTKKGAYKGAPDKTKKGAPVKTKTGAYKGAPVKTKTGAYKGAPVKTKTGASVRTKTGAP